MKVARVGGSWVRRVGRSVASRSFVWMVGTGRDGYFSLAVMLGQGRVALEMGRGVCVRAEGEGMAWG